MADSNSAATVLETNTVSLSISADESPKFSEDHGFFYQADAEIGKLVDKLYIEGRARSDDSLSHFRPRLLEVPVSNHAHPSLCSC